MGRICFAVVLLFSGVVYASPPRYTVHELPELSGANILSLQLNDSGHIVGQVRLPDNSWRGFLYADGDYAEFGDLLGDGLVYLPQAFNNLGQVVLYRNPQYWLYTDGELELLPFGSGDSIAAMNDYGAIVGETRALGESHSGAPKMYREAFIYKDGVMTLIVDPPQYAEGEEEVIESGGFGEFTESYASDINNSGLVAGVLTGNIEGSNEDWFSYDNGAVQGMNALDDTAVAPALNNQGQLAGSGTYDYVSGLSYLDSTLLWRLEAPFALHSDPLLGTFVAWDARIYGINDNGDSVGTFTGWWAPADEIPGTFGALIDQSGEPYALIEYLAAGAEWDNISGAVQINNNGWILATGIRNGQTIPVLLEPLPPTAVQMNVSLWDPLNRVAPNSAGTMNVMLGGASVALDDGFDFDATQIDPASLRFGIGGAPNVLGPWFVDADADTTTDALVGFAIQEAGIFCGDDTLSVSGETYAGEQFTAIDSIQTIDCEESSCHP